jgi:hypothetical protein
MKAVLGLALPFAAGAATDTPAVAPDRPAADVGSTYAAAGPARKDASLIEIAVRGGKVELPDNRIVVTQGAEVQLHWTSDRPIVLHLHGYDIEARVAPDAPATMAFRARLAGRFPVSEHRQDASHHRALLYLEVHP